MKRNLVKNVCMSLLCAMLCVGFSGCNWLRHEQEPRTIFSFSLRCSEDLLDFVTPVALYVDENGDRQEIELTKSTFEKVDQSGLLNPEFAMYIWKKQIVLKSEKGQREMQVSYKLRNDATQIDNDKTYIMYHKLSGGHEQTIGGVTITGDGDNTVTVNGQDINRTDVLQYLNDLQNNPDRHIEEVK